VTSNPQNLLLVQGIIQIGHNLNLQVVAEGVETIEQANLLNINTCDKLQGYYFSRPITLPRLTEYLGKNKNQTD
jgi:EAL domain-containing protein (putative c-di-GMP-specific phosphodiesterase class I)